MGLDFISVSNMRESDKYTIENFVDSKLLMYRAALAVSKAHEYKGKVAIVCGSGNNGGDGYGLAYILAKKKVDVKLVLVSEKKSEDGLYFYNLAKEAGVEEINYTVGCLKDFTIIVDCMLGTGFKGDLNEKYYQIAYEINHSKAYVIAVDINSGLNGDSGESSYCVNSDLTVTIGFMKKGFLNPDVALITKKIVVCDIGIHLLEKEFYLEQYPAYICDEIIDVSKVEMLKE